MMSSRLFLCVALLLAGHTAAQAPSDWKEKVDDDGRKVQSLQIQAPSMTEEDQYGYTMPDQYRCDACKVVAYHLSEALLKAQPKNSNRRLKEWEYQELFDETCAKGFTGYGVALVHGENVLSGPALKRDNLEPGMGAIQMGGETWEKRLGEICRKFVYEKVGEDEVYDHFRSKGEVSSDLCFRETRDCKLAKLGPEPAPKMEKKEKKSKQPKKKAVGKAADIDVKTFISTLADKHGLSAVDYTKKRSFAEWEQLFVQITKRISDHTEPQGNQAVDV